MRASAAVRSQCQLLPAPSLMLLLKLTLVPLLLLANSLAGRRWGPAVAGRLTGLPVVAGPILWFLTLEQGAGFGAQAASASLAAVAAVLCFSVTYARCCEHRSWGMALIAAAAAWGLAVLMLSVLPLGNSAVTALVAVVALWVAPRAFPVVQAAPGSRPLTALDLGVRMVVGALLTLLITGVAAALGAGWSGLVTTYPVLTSVMAVSSHRSQGAAFTAALLRAMVPGLYAFAGFCAGLAWLLPRAGTSASLIGAIVAALATQAAVRGTVGGLLRGTGARTG